MKFIIKRAIKMLLGNRQIQIMVSIYLAEKLVARTDNTLDDRILEVLRECLGEAEEL